MAVRLVVTENGDPGSEYIRSFLQDRIVVGRSRSSDICLPHMAVSTRHAEIQLDGNDYVVVDLDSVNGTVVDGKKLVPHRRHRLRNNDTIQIADFQLVFNLGVAAAPKEPRGTSLKHARDMLASLLSRSGQEKEPLSLLVLSGPHRASRFELPEAPATVTIGRGSEVDIALDDWDISRKHASITVSDKSLDIRDLSSRNGVVIDGEKMESATLEVGAEFTLGKTTIAVEHPTDRTLGVIFEAPEEETSSFVSVAQPRTQVPTKVVDEPVTPEPNTAQSKKEDDHKSKDDVEPVPSSKETPPVGPKDPLVGTASDLPRWQTDPALKRVETDGHNDRTDAGLIIVGAIILLASIAALIYLFS